MRRKKKEKRALNRSITIGCISFISMLCVLLSMVNLTIYRNYVYRDYREYITDILNYTLSHVDGDDLEECIRTGERSEKYNELLLFMDNLMEGFSDIHYFYSVLLLNTESTGNVMSVLSAERFYDRYIDTEGNLYLGWISNTEFDSETAAQLMGVMEGRNIVFFEEKTEWGTDYTGAVPIRNSDGKAIAVLAVDIDISFLGGMILEYALANIILIIAAGVFFTGMFLLWSRRNITLPIKQLEESAVGFVDHSHGQRDLNQLSFDAPEMDVENEIKSLSDAVVRMTEDIRDYVSDIVSAEDKANRMQELANRDTLTGIRNKTAYDHDIQKLEGKLAKGDTKIGLAIVDLNFLKRINDTYGHDKGNAAIKKLSAIICAIFVHSPVFRIGGDEFAIILRRSDYDNHAELISKFEEEIEKMAKDDSLSPWEQVSASIGAALFDPELDDDLDSLFRRADQVMYDRKKQMKAIRSE